MWKKIKTHPWWTVIAVVLIAAVVWLVYRQWFAPKPGPNLITATVTRGDIEDSVLATGAIQAAQLTDVGSQVSGQLKKLYVKVGEPDDGVPRLVAACRRPGPQRARRTGPPTSVPTWLRRRVPPSRGRRRTRRSRLSTVSA